MISARMKTIQIVSFSFFVLSFLLLYWSITSVEWMTLEDEPLNIFTGWKNKSVSKAIESFHCNEYTSDYYRFIDWYASFTLPCLNLIAFQNGSYPALLSLTTGMIISVVGLVGTFAWVCLTPCFSDKTSINDCQTFLKFSIYPAKINLWLIAVGYVIFSLVLLQSGAGERMELASGSQCYMFAAMLACFHNMMLEEVLHGRYQWLCRNVFGDFLTKQR
eukprot:Filipodium_phascolosomae@DN3884_c0_g1_i1.p1